MFSSQSSNFCWDVTVQPNRHAHCHGSEQVLYYNKSVTNPPTCGSIKRFHRNKNTAGLACRYNQPWHRSLWVTERGRLEEKPPLDRTHASCKLPHADISVPNPNYVAPIQTNVTFQSTCKSSFASGQPLEAMRRTRVCHLSHRSRYPSPDHRGDQRKVIWISIPSDTFGPSWFNAELDPTIPDAPAPKSRRLGCRMTRCDTAVTLRIGLICMDGVTFDWFGVFLGAFMSQFRAWCVVG